MAHPYERPEQLIRLDVLKFALRKTVGAGVIDSLRAEQSRDYLTQSIALTLTAELLAEKLPPVKITDRVEFTVPRYATWIDHLVATYRSRWWARLLRWHRRPLRYVDEPHSHVTDVTVRGAWTYPRATTVLPGRQYGHVVYKASTDCTGWEQPW